MKVMVLGSKGMLGHKLCQVLSDHDITGIDKEDINVLDYDLLKGVMATIRPDWVINCVGAIPQKKWSNQEYIELNSLFPYKLSEICSRFKTKMIHLSTDCVFSGKKGMYSETDKPDPKDIYGMTKYIGEITENPNVLTIRTSMIGPELSSHSGLFGWFLSQKGKIVNGYTGSLFSGLTTLELSGIIRGILNHPMNGLYNISAEPISKFELLEMINTEMKLGITVIRTGGALCDRTLDDNKFRIKSKIEKKSWSRMIKELGEDMGVKR